MRQCPAEEHVKFEKWAHHVPLQQSADGKVGQAQGKVLSEVRKEVSGGEEREGTREKRFFFLGSTRADKYTECTFKMFI